MSGDDDAVPGVIDTGMVLAAGLGKRMRPITDTLPKPLVTVAGRTMLDHALDRLAQAGIARAVVNVHHLADSIEAHLAARTGAPAITISDERDALLETGGGIRRALPLLGASPFLAMNADTLWIEGPHSNLRRLIEAYDPARMDMLLLLAPVADAVGYEGQGDFNMDARGRLSRRPEHLQAPFIYAGAGIAHAGLFADTPDGAFSLNLLFDRAIDAGRLYGLRLDGEWLHVGTPDAIAEAEAHIARAR
ncbi:MAG: nucleotidyltransferase family protein [Salinarimonas sp.]|nr:nucleotidyltransferase family protein [Salinarimonas sp.]